MVGRVLLEPTLAFKLSELSEVFTIEQIENASLVLTPKVPDDFTTIKVVFKDVVSLDVVESGFVDPPLSFDILSGFFFHSDDVLTISSMDLRFFEYFPASCDDDITSCSPRPPTTHVFDIDNEPLQGDLDESYQSDFGHDLTKERVLPTFDDPETVNLGTTDEF